MKSNVPLIAIAVVAIVVVSGIGIYVLSNNSKGGEEIDKGSLPVFGNANGDNLVNSEDVDLINKMIDEQIPLDEHPFADANRNGAVDAGDIEIVNKLINGEPTSVTFVDQYDLFKDNYRYVTIDYPLKDVVTQNADMLMLTVMIDADKCVAGYIANIESYPNQFHKVLNNGVSKQIGSTARYIAASDWVGIKDLDIELQSKGSKIGAIIVHSDSALGDYKDDIIASQIPLIYLRCTDPVYSIDAAVLLGFLLGPEHASKAVSFGEDCRQTIVKLQKDVSKISENDKKRFIALNMKIYVAENGSQYTNIGIQAGGVEMSGLEGTASTKLQDTEAITRYNDKIDYMLNCSTQDCRWVEPSELWELGDMRYLEKSTHYHDMVWINMSMPVPCRVMYAASIFYPDLVSRADADSYLQNTIDKYMSYLDSTVSDGDFDIKTDMFTVITYQDYIDSNGGTTPESKVTSDISALEVAQHFFDNMDFTTYQGGPYTVSGDDQEAHVYPTSGKYYVDVKLYNDAKSVFDEKKAGYLSKVGTQSSMSGTYYAIEFPTGLTDGYGYYVNTENADSIGSMYYAGYIKECYIEIHMGKKPSLSNDDLRDIVDAAWGKDSTVSALTSASNLDLTLLNGMDYAPYTIKSGGTALFAKIGCSDNDNNKDYYITYNSRSDGLIDFMNNKAKYKSKAGGDYMGGTAVGVEKCDFDDGYGFYGNTDASRNLSMLQFTGCKNGCYVTIYLRAPLGTFDDATAASIVNAVAATIS